MPEPSKVARHDFREHVGELELVVDAPTLADAFAEAGRALASIVAGDAPLAALGAEENVTVRAHDTEALLVAWLNELVYLGETQKKVFPEISVEMSNGITLRATVRGAEPSRIRTQVKAATMHRVRVRTAPDGVHARVVLDV